MNKMKDLFECLLFDNTLSINENFDNYQCTFKSNLSGNIDETDFRSCTNFVSVRDYLILSVIVDDSEPIQFDSRNTDVHAFIQNVSGLFVYLDKDDEKNVECQIKIYKNKCDNILSIYCLDSFTDFLETLPFNVLLDEFAKVSTDCSGLTLELICDQANLKTTFFSLTNNLAQDLVLPQSSARIIDKGV